MVPSAAKIILTVFIGKKFSLSTKSISQILLIISMAPAFTINESHSCNSSLKSLYKNDIIGA